MKKIKIKFNNKWMNMNIQDSYNMENISNFNIFYNIIEKISNYFQKN